jgi:hypothetical protein
VRLSVGSYTSTQPLTLVEDPRITKDGVTTLDLAAQFAHNTKVRDLVSDANRNASRLRQAQQRLKGANGAAADTLSQLNDVGAKLFTPSIRYSKPELLTHIQYLYSATNSADQKPGRDAIQRAGVLRRELDVIVKELDRLLGRGPLM